MPDVPEKHTELDANEAEEALDVAEEPDDEVTEKAKASVADEAVGTGATDADDLDAAEQALADDLDSLIAERDRYLDHLKRVQADYENHVKRTNKRVDERVARELGDLVEQLLPVLDACDAAAAQGENEAVEPIAAQLYGVLKKQGLERIDPKGESFDPAVAEAVLHDPGEGGEQVVSEVMRTGYRWKGRILRPALVKVTD